MTDSSTGKVIWVPPSLGALRAAAYTFQAFAPGWAAAGQNRGYLPEALAVRYPKINDAALQASYGNGQVINSILLKNGIIQVYGNNTTQRANTEMSAVNTEMSAVNNVTAVFFSVNGLDTLGQKYVFDPDDDILLTQIYQDFSGFLQGLVKQRVIADYGLVIDHTNNTPQTRAQRMVVVSYSVIPQDAAERIFINCTVNAAGATLVSSSVSNS
jgi:phage tail sheath protein FI